MSAFIDFINLLRLEVNIYHNAKVCGNWRIGEHTLGATCFHVVTSGNCWLKVPGQLETIFNQGDLVIFPKELAHSMGPVALLEGEQQHLDYNSPLKGTGLLCGEVSFLHLYRNQLLDALPPVLLIRNEENTSWLAHLTELLLQESLRAEPADSITINRLSELLFIYALRHYLEQHSRSGNRQAGILALYSEPRLAKAVKAFHAAPEQKWDLQQLAKVAGMSRTAFTQAFRLASGWTVNQYTTWWRMQLAWERLGRGDKVIDVALQVGYQSEAAFSRAFRKQFGVSAGSVRRGATPHPVSATSRGGR